MRTGLTILLAFILLPACRTSRATVDVMDANAPSNPPSADFDHVGASTKTSVKISAMSLPASARSYERLDLSIRKADTPEEKVRIKEYTIGEAVPINPHESYEIILGAWMGGTELYSTRFCKERQVFRAEDGANTYTASLCAKP